MAKTFSIIKVGYSAGVYGCTGEYFQTTILKEDGEIIGLPFYGLYGSESRIAHALKEAGYTEKYTKSGGYGQLRGEQRKHFLSEEAAINQIKAGL